MEWSDSYLTGVDSIDRQHMDMLSAADTFHESIRRGGGEAHRHLQALISCMEVHITEEEELLRRGGRSGFGRHKRTHAALLANVRSLHGYIEANALNPYTGQFIITETEKWITEHFKRMDRSIAFSK